MVDLELGGIGRLASYGETAVAGDDVAAEGSTCGGDTDSAISTSSRVSHPSSSAASQPSPNASRS